MFALIVVAALVAQGEEPEECEIVCQDAATLAFCDDGDTVTLACADVDPGAVCATKDDFWGDDCLLPAGAACDPAYAYGRSRCAVGLACNDGTCAPGTQQAPPVLEPTAGTALSNTTSTTSTSFLNCQSCNSAPAFVLCVPGLALRLRRRR